MVISWTKKKVINNNLKKNRVEVILGFNFLFYVYARNIVCTLFISGKTQQKNLFQCHKGCVNDLKLMC